MKTISTDHKLKERVKELKCLYAISKIAAAEEYDLNSFFSRVLTILPPAMQYPDSTEVRIQTGKEIYETSNFSRCKTEISASLMIGKKKYGVVKIGYRPLPKKKSRTLSFLPEEKKLIKTVSRELALYIKRASVEDEKKKLQMQLQHSERLAFVGELSAGIAHELNEPFGRILGFAQLIKKSGDLNPQQNEDVDRIIKASLYTREIIKKLMIFSRQMPQQIVPVNLNSTVTDILYFIDVRFQARNIQIMERLDMNLPIIQADAVQMSQLLVNLITNAIHALPGGGEIVITTKRSGKNVVLSVKDNGVGISASTQKKIFKPFFTTKEVGQGTGLGLSVVQGIIEAHHGKITVKSAPGKGSLFKVMLPLKQ